MKAESTGNNYPIAQMPTKPELLNGEQTVTAASLSELGQQLGHKVQELHFKTEPLAAHEEEFLGTVADLGMRNLLYVLERYNPIRPRGGSYEKYMLGVGAGVRDYSKFIHAENRTEFKRSMVNDIPDLGTSPLAKSTDLAKRYPEQKELPTLEEFVSEPGKDIETLKRFVEPEAPYPRPLPVRIDQQDDYGRLRGPIEQIASSVTPALVALNDEVFNSTLEQDPYVNANLRGINQAYERLESQTLWQPTADNWLQGGGYMQHPKA